MTYGLEIIIETALFLLEYGHFKDDQFHIYNVTGPDEYTVLVNDNYFTNKAAKEHFKFAIKFINNHDQEVKDILNRLKFTSNDFDKLKKAEEQIVLLKDETLHIVKQDASFLDRKDIDLTSLDQNKFPMLLFYHPLFLYQHQIIKQADAILALVMFNDVDHQTFKNSFDYYMKRTTHDSSLSKCIHGIAAYQIGYTDLAYEYFKKVAELDFRDNHNRTQHGLHVANLGGSYLMLLYGILGFRFSEVLTLNPVYQEQITHMKTAFTYESTHIKISIENDYLKIEVDKPINIHLYDRKFKIEHTFETKIKKSF